MFARGYAEILACVFSGTRLLAIVESIRFLRPDVAAADVTLEGQNFPFGLGKALPLLIATILIATREQGAWSIAIFRNAIFRKMLPFHRPMAGPLERELLEASLAR